MKRHFLTLTLTLAITVAAVLLPLPSVLAEPIAIGSQRELFVDRHLIDQLDQATLKMHAPRPVSVALKFDKPWEGIFSGYITVLHDAERGLYRMYYRGTPTLPTASNKTEYTCYAESKDGRVWTKPNLGLHEAFGTKDNNILLANDPIATHNFAPFLDTNPDTPPDQRYKALSGLGGKGGGLRAWASPDGLKWQKLREEPVLTKGAFDSQNVAFWSAAEKGYVAYFRVFTGGGTDEKTWKPKGVRWVSRSTSTDFVNWTPAMMMKCDRPLVDHIYVSQTQPYFRAPHIEIATAARFMQGRSSLDEQAKKYLAADAKAYTTLFADTSEAVLMTSRAGSGLYNRTFMEGFVRPGLHFRNWTSRSNYPACGLIQTGKSELSLFVQRHYGQGVNLVERCTLRLDGFASLHADYEGGHMITKPLSFTGKTLHLNFATGAAGHVAVEIQDETGAPIPGFTLADCVAPSYDDIDRVIHWKSGSDVSALAGKPVRLKFDLRDADVFSMWFAP
jgi:hypothetical protein